VACISDTLLKCFGLTITKKQGEKAGEKMTNQEIQQNKQKLHNIQTQPPDDEQTKQIITLAEEIGASIPHWIVSGDSSSRNIINQISSNIHTVLQTESMLNACVSAEQSCELAKQSSITAKWACIWAAVAAIAACISIALSLFMK